MYVVKSRWLALAAISLGLFLVSGCQIDSSGPGSGGELRYVKVSPDLKLHAEPEGYIYELWIFSIGIENDTVPVFGQPEPLVRFKWDPYLYAASDEDGNFLPLTLANGMELPEDIDLARHFAINTQTAIAMLTLEPIDDPSPLVPNGPTILALNINPQSFSSTIISPYLLLSFLGVPQPSGSYFLLSQSNKKGSQNPTWRDNRTEGYGIWFANPRLEDQTTLDSINCWDAYTRVFVPSQGDPYTYAVWIHKVHPESSFSNFGRVLASREPDFEFRDGEPIHAPRLFGPSEINNLVEPPQQGVQLGTDPVLSDGVVVGYRYIIDNTIGPDDTCIIRVDDPSLTRCNRDTFQVLTFDESSLLPKVFRVTDGDTTMGPALAGLLDVGSPEALAQLPNGAGFLFTGWEYEAWLVFTQESGIPPLSLGRFKGPSGFDSGNPYTYTDSRYDANFHFPGEDFLQNLSSHHPALTSPLDVIHDPKVEKIWITIEPDDDFGYDWAPDEPNTQFIYMSGYLPKDIDSTQAMQFPLILRDLNPSPTGLNNGNFFPSVNVQFLPAPSE